MLVPDPPGVHEYDTAPFAVSVAVPWKGGPQIMELLVSAVTVGVGITLIHTDAPLLQPTAFVPITEKVQAHAGLIGIHGD
jgi:hypothetical protein